MGFAPGPPPGSIAPWTPTYYGRIRSLRVALLLAFGRFAPCASLSRSLQGGLSSNSRWGCPRRQPYAVPSQSEGRATADGWAANHHCFFKQGTRACMQIAPMAQLLSQSTSSKRSDAEHGQRQ